MDKGIETLLGKIFDEPKKSVVGVMTGRLLDDWGKLSYEKSLLNMKRHIAAESFAVNFFLRRKGDWWNPASMVDRTIKAYEIERAEERKSFDRQQKILEDKEQSLWNLTFEKFSLKPSDRHTVAIDSGEVFRCEVSADA